MTRVLIAGGALVAVVLARGGEATVQTRPDFSGTWKIDEKESSPPPSPPPGPPAGATRPAPPPPPRTVGLTIAHSNTELQIERSMLQGDRTLAVKLVYRLDGTESVNQIGPIVSKSTVSWQDSMLAISSVNSIDDRPLGESKEIYRLDGGRLLIEHSRTTPAGTMSGKSVYIRGN